MAGKLMRYLVTGGAGFIGSNMVRRLSAEGHVVRVLDDGSRGNWKRLEGARYSRFEGDVRDREAVRLAVKACDSVIHMAMVQGTQNFTEKPSLTMGVAIRGTLNVLDACEEFGVRDFMLLSSSETYQGERDKVPTDESVWLSIPDVLNPRFAYGGGKVAMELMCVHRGIFDRLIIARPHNVYGPDAGHEHIIPQFCDRMNAMKPARQYDFPILGTGQETRAYCYIEDCVDALSLLLEKAPSGTSVWHVGTPDERSATDVAHALAEAYEQPITVIPGELPKGSPPRRCPDISKLRALGYEPKVSFAEGIQRTAAWYRGAVHASH